MFLFYLFVVGINIDFQIDRDTNSLPYVIVNYSVPYSDLIFRKNDTIYTGEILTSLVLKKDNYQLGGSSSKSKILVSEYNETVSDLFYHKDSPILKNLYNLANNIQLI